MALLPRTSLAQLRHVVTGRGHGRRLLLLLLLLLLLFLLLLFLLLSLALLLVLHLARLSCLRLLLSPPRVCCCYSCACSG